MEELDDLKSIWKQQSQGFDPKNEAEIAQMLRGRSKSIIAKLKRSVWFELIFTVLCGIAMGIYGFYAKSGAMAWMVLTLASIFVVYLFYYVKKIILLNRYELHSQNVKINLHHLVERLSVYLVFYKRSYSILYPVFFCLGLLFGALETGIDKFLQKFTNIGFTLWFALFTLVFMVGVYKITDWYLKKLYGNHLDKLKNLLAELQG